MIKNICIYSIIILAICIAPVTGVMALHDDEAIGKGGAWKSTDKAELPASADSEKSIDKKLDKAFQKSPIIIPEMDKAPIEDDSNDPKNKEAENPDSSEQ